MTVPQVGYDLNGFFDYGITYGGSIGNMSGRGARLDDDRLIGIVEDRDNGARSGTLKYLLGNFHSKGLSILKIPPVDRGMMVVAWALKKEGDAYKGGWAPLETTIGAIGLAASPTLQSILALDHSHFDILSPEYFDTIIEDAESDGRTVELNLKESDLSIIRQNLGI